MKEYVINLFGVDFTVTFSPHSLIRCFQRNVAELVVLNSLKTAEEEVGDFVKDKHDFIIIDETENISFVAKCHFRDITIDIKTVLNKTDITTHGDELIIRIKEDGTKKVDIPNVNRYN